MSTLIIGSGLSGLLTAINIRNNMPGEEVIVADPNNKLSNSLIAGQRIRAGIANRRTDPMVEIMELLQSRNGGEVTEPMRIFTKILLEELERWQKAGIPFTDDHSWFGPQWGDSKVIGVAKSKTVLDFFKSLAESKGAQFINLKTTKLNVQGNKLTSILACDNKSTYELDADNIVLAGGSSTGTLFQSTNRDFELPPQVLASEAGIALYDSTLTMIHPFGKCGSDNKPVAGCYETDLLTDVKILNANSHNASWIEELLQKHQAHYHFPKICESLWESGSVLELQNSQDHIFKTCVAIHYNHLGIKTDDGTTVHGLDNLYAVGDASGVGFFTNHKVRYPGFAIGNCLVTAHLAASQIKAKKQKSTKLSITNKGFNTTQVIPKLKKTIKEINTRYVCEIALNKKVDPDICRKWTNELENIQNYGDLSGNEIQILNLSKKIASAHHENVSKAVTEPIII